MSTAGWKELKLGDLCKLRAGSVFKIQYQGQTDGDYPFAKVSDMNLHGNEIYIQGANHWISESVLSQIKARPFKSGTTVFAKIGEALRQNRVRYLIRDTLIDNNMMGAVPNLDIVDPKFLFYRLSNFDIASKASGAALPFLSAGVLAESRFSVPPIATQQTIASLLAAYDDLIVNNQRRIELLQRATRLLFAEWFVHLRYPGHQQEKPSSSLPIGWRTQPLSQLAERITDGSHWSPATIDEGMPMASVKDMRDWDFDLSTCRQISDADFSQLVKNDCKPRKDDIVVSKDGANLNKYAFLVTEERELVILSSIAIIRPTPSIEPEFLLSALKSPQVSEAIRRKVSGVAIPRIVLKDFKSVEIVVPPISIQRAWTELVRPVHDQCRNLTDMNDALRRARDLLLPRLMDGRIAV